MEEAKATQPNSLPKPPSQASNPSITTHTHPPQLPTHSVAPKTKKRPLEHSLLHDPSYCKMRSVIKDLRPHFLEALRTPDFRSCKASGEIRMKLKVLKELCKLMTTERVSQQNSTNVTGISNESYNVKKLQEKPKQTKPGEYPQADRPLKGDGDHKGSYVVGGSAFGWNFITYRSKEAVYYGVTKEQFRTRTRIF